MSTGGFVVAVNSCGLASQVPSNINGYFQLGAYVLHNQMNAISWPSKTRQVSFPVA
jgi:hypothetical protein